MHKHKLKFTFFTLFLCLLFAFSPICVLAEEEQKAYDILPVVGITPIESNCPLTVTEAKFTFKINAFPSKETDLSTLDSTALFEYKIGNPTTEAITAKLKFTLGKVPEYGTNAFPEDKISLTVNENTPTLTNEDKDGTLIRTFEITLDAGTNTTIKASAPLYAGTDITYIPTVYSYALANSGIKAWKSFGTYTLRLETPYHVVGSSFASFKTSDEGYAEIKFDTTRPEDDFSLYLCTVENPKNPSVTRATIILVLIMILITFGPILITFLIIFIVRKVQKNKQKKRYENRYNFYK